MLSEPLLTGDFLRSYHSNDVTEAFADVVHVKWLSFCGQHHVPDLQERGVGVNGERSLQGHR